MSIAVEKQHDFANKVIRASAGTGKTFQLTNHYLALLRVGEVPSQILATTFTRKAAGEILDRVIFRLADAAQNPNVLKELSVALKLGEISRDDCLQMLQTVVRNLHRLKVGTLDSFFAQIAGSFSLELGLPPGWQINDESTEDRLRRDAVAEMLRGESTGDLQTLISLLTKGEAQRSISQLVHSTVVSLYSEFQQSPGQAWHRLPRFKRYSDEQLREDFAQFQNISIPTDRKWEQAHRTACDAVTTLDWETLVSSGIALKILSGQTKFNRKEIEPDVKEAYDKILGYARATLVNQLADQTEATYRLLKKFDEHFVRLKYQQHGLHFDDVTNRLAKRASVREIERLAFRLGSHISHLLLDEFQDTSLAQWTVIEPFAQRITRPTRHAPGVKREVGEETIRVDHPQAESQGKSFFCVGDMKQAIYGWRGGIAEIFDAVDQRLSGLTTEPLDESYRSSSQIIEVVNMLFSNLAQHPNLEGIGDSIREWCTRFRQHETTKKDLSGYACLLTGPVAGQEDSQAEITLQYAARHVADLHRQSRDHTIGVLVRRNFAVGQLIYHLRSLGINASEEGGNPLTDSAAVQAMLSLLRLADHPGDLVARFHLVNSPLAQDVGLENENDHSGAKNISEILRSSLIELGYGPTLYRWAQPLAASCNHRELNRLEQLIALAYRYQAFATLRPSDFIRFVERQKITDPSEANVRVMTIHQAKGLEFDIVVLPDLDAELIGQRGTLVVGRASPTEPIDRVCRYRNEKVRKLLPESIQEVFEANQQRDIAESLCVLYVAATRAVHALHMIVAPSQSSRFHKTYSGLLRAALTENQPMNPESLIFQHGDPNWLGSTKPSIIVSNNDDTAVAIPTIRLKSSDGGRRRGLDRRSPSSLEGGSQVRLSHVFDDRGADARQRGTIIHAWFEQIHWLEDGRPDNMLLGSVANQVSDAPLLPLELNGLIRQFHSMLDQAGIAEVLKRDFYEDFGNVELNVENERPIAVRDGDQLLAGTIDRLVTIRSGGCVIAADVIDFKTDMIAADDADAMREKISHYSPQLEAYRRAVSQMLHLSVENISSRLLLLTSGQAEEV